MTEAIFSSLGLPYCLRPEQKAVITFLAEGENVLAILPTGYGKSDCFGLFPRVWAKMQCANTGPMALVISPLKALVNDQVSKWNARGVPATTLSPQTSYEEILSGNFELLFASPEAIQTEQCWTLLTKIRRRVCLLALDEIHCLATWGSSFRPEYQKVPDLRALFSGVPVLGLTATATTALRDELCDTLALSFRLVSKVPDRPNIHLSIVRTDKEFEDAMAEYLHILQEMGLKAPKMLIYARTIDSVADLWGKITFFLQEEGKDARSRTVEMYHSGTEEQHGAYILNTFTSPSSHIRCIVATVAFGLGVSVPDIHDVIHWGPPSDILTYWQEVGRCARHLNTGEAVMFVPRGTMNKRFINNEMLELVRNALANSQCIRLMALSHLRMDNEMAQTVGKNQYCCSVCDAIMD